MRRDVTVLLSPDGNDELGVEASNAVAAIEDGHHAVVHDDATAVLVLTGLGLTKVEAINQVRLSPGPLLGPSHPLVRHLMD